MYKNRGWRHDRLPSKAWKNVWLPIHGHLVSAPGDLGMMLMSISDCWMQDLLQVFFTYGWKIIQILEYTQSKITTVRVWLDSLSRSIWVWVNIGYQTLYASRSSKQSLYAKGSQLLTHGLFVSGDLEPLGSKANSSYGKTKWNPCMSKAIYMLVGYAGIPPMMFRRNSPVLIAAGSPVIAWRF